MRFLKYNDTCYNPLNATYSRARQERRLHRDARENPLEDLRALQHLELVVCCGRAVKNPSPKRRKEVDAPWFPDPDLCPEQRPGSLHLVQTHVGVGYRMLRVEPDEL